MNGSSGPTSKDETATSTAIDRRTAEVTPSAARVRGLRQQALSGAALGYAELDWAVLPLDGKLPRTAHGHHDASTDPRQVARWWRHWPTANIGVVVPDGVLVLDVDPRNGGDVAALGDLPATRTCLSGRGDGGLHKYFIRPPGALTRTRLPVGIDVKVSGYVVAPPSLHPATGQPYRWVDPEHPISPLPEHLRDLLTAPGTTLRASLSHDRGSGGVNTRGNVKSALVGLVATVLTAEPGNRNSALHWAACRLAEHVRDGRIGEGAARVLMSRAGEQAGLDADEVRMTVASAFTVVRDV